MNIIFNPLLFFMSIQIISFLVWLVLPSDWFYIIMPGAIKAEITLKSAVIFVIMLVSFFYGTKFIFSKKNIQKNTIFIKENDLSFLLFIHKTSLIITLISTLAIVLFMLSSMGITFIFDLIENANANLIKNQIYSAPLSVQILMMGRHLILISMVSWILLLKYKKAHFTNFTIILFCSIVLFFFTSSRLTLMSIILIYFISKFKNERSFFKGLILFLIIVSIFGLGVLTRSSGTWEGLTGSSNIFVIIGAEFLAYFVSPVNYSVAVINENIAFNISSITTFFTFIYSILNIEIPSFTSQISEFYVSSLTQMGILGQIYPGYGPLIIIPLFFYGYISSRLYYLFKENNVMGQLLYPLIFITLFDSFRGFLLFQSIIFSNFIFFLFITSIYRLLKKGKRRGIIEINN